MGLFDKIFAKNENKTPEKQKDRITFDSPYGEFVYSAAPACNEYGYETETDWYTNGTRADKTTVYIDTDTPETTEAGICYERLERLLSDKERTDLVIKKYAADFFLSKPELLRGDHSEEELIDELEIVWIGLYRNGDTRFSFDTYWTDADDVAVVIKADGSKSVVIDGH